MFPYETITKGYFKKKIDCLRTCRQHALNFRTALQNKKYKCFSTLVLYTNNSVVKAWVWGQDGLEGVNGGRREGICNTFNNNDVKKNNLKRALLQVIPYWGAVLRFPTRGHYFN